MVQGHWIYLFSGFILNSKNKDIYYEDTTDGGFGDVS